VTDSGHSTRGVIISIIIIIINNIIFIILLCTHRDLYFPGTSWLHKALMASWIRPKSRTRIDLQGMGKRPREEMIARAIEEIDAIAALLGDKPYALGDRPCTLDATLYGFLANMMGDFR
jgi:glutathione S-transferase